MASSVDFDIFLEWCIERFGEENVKIKHTAHGDEICTHSWFAKEKGIEDHKFHLWMNPSGGKKELGGGAYRCWYTDTMGSLVSLVADYDHIPYEEAEELICGSNSLRTLEQKVNDFFGCHERIDEVVTPSPVLPDFSFLIDNMSSYNFWRIKAENYLQERKIPTDGLYVCTGGEYKNRIIIPYYNSYNQMIFYNARTMSDNPKTIRYMKPPKGDQKQVLFMTKWPKTRTKVYVMEGEFDAISVGTAGYVGCACGGKYLSDTQVEMLRAYDPVLAFDADTPGLEALINIGNDLLAKGFPRVSFVRPPKVYKDWNELLKKRNVQTLRSYIDRFETSYTSMTETVLRMNQL